MGATLGRVDVVREREDGFDVRGVPLHGHLDLAVVGVALEENDVLVDGVLRVVDVRDEVADAALVVELLGLAPCPLVAQDDPQAAREKRGLAEPLRERRGRKLRLVEDLRVRQEGDRRARLLLARDADRLHLGRRLASSELLAVDLPVASDLGDEPFGQGIDDRDADAVEAAGHLVAVPAELSPGVKLRQDDCESREPLLGDDVDRDARAGVAHGHRVVRMNGDVDPVVAPRESLVDGVVDDLVDEVVQAPGPGRSDVHPGPQPNGLEALENGDVFCGVGCFGHQKSPANRHIAGPDKSTRNGGRSGP